MPSPRPTVLRPSAAPLAVPLFAAMMLTACAPPGPPADRIGAATGGAAPAANAPAATSTPTTAATPLAIERVTVVPMDANRRLPDHTVIVVGDRIVAMGPSATTPVPANATRVDGRGRFLMPGLAEMHAHVPGGNASDALVRHVMLLYVANGITTIRGMLGAPAQFAMRRRIQAGEMLGPAFHIGAPSLNGTSAPIPAIADSLVRVHAAAGYDLLKIHPGLSRATYDAAMARARAVGITAAGHVPTDVGLLHALEAGQSTIDHLDGYLEAAVPAGAGVPMPTGPATMTPAFLAAVDTTRFAELARRTRDAGTWNVPTAYLWESFYDPDTVAMLAREELRWAPPQWIAGWTAQKRAMTAQQRAIGTGAAEAATVARLRRALLRALDRADAPLLLGTDSPQMFNVPGFALHRELRLLQDAGLSPYRILRSGTADVARYARTALGDTATAGVVRVGARADLLLLEADPLAEVRHVGRRAGVVLGGRWLSETELTAMLERSLAAARGG